MDRIIFTSGFTLGKETRHERVDIQMSLGRNDSPVLVRLSTNRKQGPYRE
jgi:hypothetical protein